jgi:type IV pilus assembly protein PilO
MALAEQIEKFSKAPLKHKAIGLVVASIIVGAIFYFLFYSELADRETGLNAQIANLQQEVATYEEKKQKYMAFRAEVNKLLEEQKELIKVLPTQAEMPNFLSSLHAQGELTGLNILTFQPGPEEPQAFYSKIPVAMAISGTYHQISKFFYSVGSLKRIVNITDLTLGEALAVEADQSILLKASFTASTFRFISPAEGQAAPEQQGQAAPPPAPSHEG